MKGRTITIANQKGGVGKTTTILNLGACLAKEGAKVLFIDLDPQGNMTFTLGLDTEANNSALDLLNGTPAAQCLQKTATGWGIASSPFLANAEPDESALKEALEPLKEKFDYILVDTGPTLGPLVIAALTAADHVLIPAQASMFSLQGLGQLFTTIQTVQEYTKPDLKILGILITIFKKKKINKDMQRMIQDTAQMMETTAFNTIIRDNAFLEEANAKQKDIFSFRPKSSGAADYAALTEEVKNRIKKED